jgi:hypothetical protein
MFKTLKKYLAIVSHSAASGWKWLSGKKRWIAVSAGLIAKLTPEHTFGHQAGAFIRDNANTIFKVISVLAIGEMAINKAKEKLLSGLKK